MHNGSGSGDVDIRIFAVAPIDPDGATQLTVAGHPATHRQVDPLVGDWTVASVWDTRIDGRGEEWIVDFDETWVAIHLTARRGTSQEELDDAHSIIDSMRYEAWPNPLGFRLVFRLTTDNWDSD